MGEAVDREGGGGDKKKNTIGGCAQSLESMSGKGCASHLWSPRFNKNQKRNYKTCWMRTRFYSVNGFLLQFTVAASYKCMATTKK